MLSRTRLTAQELRSHRYLGPDDLRGDAKSALPRLHGALLKNEQDVQVFERLAFLARGQR